MNSQLQKTTATPMLGFSEQQAPIHTDHWQQIASLAYLKAEARGFSPGHELDDWLKAERELAAEFIDEMLAA